MQAMAVNPKVSVIVPVYNVEKFIERCVRSLFEQTLKDIEYIFVDDGSSDASLEILQHLVKEYPERESDVYIIRQPVNGGVSLARNRGLESAHGEYVVLCDSDDWLELDMYEKMYDKAKEVDADIVGCDFYEEYPDHRSYISQSFDVPQEDFIKKMLYGAVGGHTWRRLIKRELFVQHHLQFFPGLAMWEDLLFSVEAHCYSKRMGYVREGLYHYVQYNTTSLVNTVNARQLESIQKVCGLLEDFLKGHGLFEKYRLAFYERVFIGKLNLVFVPELRDYHRWQTYYPEANKYIGQYHMATYNKILFTLVRWKLYVIVDLALVLKKFLWMVLNK